MKPYTRRHTLLVFIRVGKQYIQRRYQTYKYENTGRIQSVELPRHTSQKTPNKENLQPHPWSSPPMPLRRVEANHHRWRPEITRRSGSHRAEGTPCTLTLVSRSRHQMQRTGFDPNFSIGRRQRPCRPCSPSSFTSRSGDDATLPPRRQPGPSTASQIRCQPWTPSIPSRAPSALLPTVPPVEPCSKTHIVLTRSSAPHRSTPPEQGWSGRNQTPTSFSPEVGLPTKRGRSRGTFIPTRHRRRRLNDASWNLSTGPCFPEAPPHLPRPSRPSEARRSGEVAGGKTGDLGLLLFASRVLWRVREVSPGLQRGEGLRSEERRVGKECSW